MYQPWTIAIVTIILTIGFPYFSSRRKKVLGWEVENTSQLVRKSADLSGRLRILFDGIETEDPHLLTIRFVNAGNQPIGEEDFASKVRLAFGSTDLLSVAVVDASPPPLNPELSPVASNIFELAPILLNPKDSFRVQVIADKKPTFTCTGKIVWGELRPLATGPATANTLVFLVGRTTLVLAGVVVVGAFLSLLLSGGKMHPSVVDQSFASKVGASLVVLYVVTVGVTFFSREKWPDRWR